MSLVSLVSLVSLEQQATTKKAEARTPLPEAEREQKARTPEVSFALTLPERLDRASASVLAAARERIEVHSIQRLSFERTRRLETAGLEALRLFCKRAHEQEASVRLERLLPEPAAVLALCGFAALCSLLPAAKERADE